MKTKKRVSKKEFIEMAISFSRKIKYDHVSSFAGHAALFLLMSLFPMVMYCISIFQYASVDARELINYIIEVLPDSLVPLFEQIIDEAYSESPAVLQSFSMLVTLFCASKGVYAVIIGMNAVYGIRETRNFVIVYALAVIYVMVFFGILGLMMILIVFGNKLFHMMMQFIPALASFQVIFAIGKYLAMLVVVLIFFLMIYMNVPNRKSKLRYEIAGALFSTVTWLAFSWAFSFYIDNYAHYSVTYGSLATIVIFILWLYGSMNIVFIGAEINVVLRKVAEYDYNYKRAYDYYKDEYEGDLLRDKDLLIRLTKHNRRE